MLTKQSPQKFGKIPNYRQHSKALTPRVCMDLLPSLWIRMTLISCPLVNNYIIHTKKKKKKEKWENWLNTSITCPLLQKETEKLHNSLILESYVYFFQLSFHLHVLCPYKFYAHPFLVLGFATSGSCSSMATDYWTMQTQMKTRKQGTHDHNFNSNAYPSKFIRDDNEIALRVHNSQAKSCSSISSRKKERELERESINNP